MRIKYGSIVVAGSGKIGGHVASKGSGGSVLRTKVTPSNRKSSFQNKVKGTLAGLASSWSSLSDAERFSFNSAVDNFKTTDIFGDLKSPSGYTLYMKLNFNLISSEQAQVTIAPPKLPNPCQPILGGSFNLADIPDANIYCEPGVPNNTRVILRATPVMGAGVYNIENFLRVIGSDYMSGDYVFFGPAYITRFGTPLIDTSFFIGVSFVNTSGQKSVEQLFKLTTFEN